MTMNFRALHALLFAIASLAVSTLIWHPDEVRNEIGDITHQAALRKALGPVRPVEGRITGLDYAPLGDSTARQPSTLMKMKRDEITSLMEDKSGQAIVALIDGNAASAVSILEQLRSQHPTDAEIASDLSAAYLALARKMEEPYFILKALDTVEAAIDNPRVLPEAQFNQALALEALALNSEAMAAWSAYLVLDATSGWASEAARRLQALKRLDKKSALSLRHALTAAVLAGNAELVKKFTIEQPKLARQLAEEVFLAKWGELFAEGKRPEALAYLAGARIVGDELARRNDDFLLQDSVKVIDETHTGQSYRLSLLSGGHKEFGEALKLYEQQKVDLSWQKFSRSRAFLTKGDSPFSLWARFYQAVDEYFRFRFDRSFSELALVQTIAKRSSYRTLSARASWLLGLIKIVQSDPYASIGYYREALSIFASTGELENVAAVNGLLGEGFDCLGRHQESWRYRYQALSLRSSITQYRRLHSILAESAEAALRQGLTRSALRFQNEVVTGARSEGNSFTLAHALLRRGITRGRIRRVEDGKGDLEEARRLSFEIDDESSSARLRAEILVAESDLAGARDPSAAIASLSEAISIFNQRGYSLLALPLYVQRANLYSSTKDSMRALEDLKSAVHVYENGKNSVLDPRDKAEFFRQSNEAFDRLTEILVIHGSHAEAFEYVERARSRALLDAISQSSTKIRRSPFSFVPPLSLREIQERMPADTAIVEYAILNDVLAIWVIESGRASFTALPTSRNVLARNVERMRNVLGGKSKELEAQSLAAMYKLLIKPIEEHIQAKKTLVIIPDKFLSLVPFGCLKRGDGKFLLETHNLLWAPSSTIFLSSLSRDKDFGSWSEARALVVAKPSLRADVFPRLTGVSVGREASTIASFYGKSVLLTGHEATEDAFLGLAGNYEVVHFAGHAFVNRSYPLLSGLALAPSENSTGALYAGEIYDRIFPRTRLVVLAACETSMGTGAASDDLASISRPFLAAGVPLVIGSLWAVEDRAAQFIAVRLHQRIAGGDDPLSALRAAQVEALNSKDEVLNRVVSWGGFTLVGGVAVSNN